MPNSEVGGLTVATTPLGGTELLHIVQSGNSRQATVQNLLNATTLAAGGALLASNNLSEVTAATARTNLGLAIGADVQAYDAGLADIAGLAVTDGNIIVGDGANWVAESGDTALASLGGGATGIAIFKDSTASAVRTEIAAAGLADDNNFTESIRVTGTEGETNTRPLLDLRKLTSGVFDYSAAAYNVPIIVTQWGDATNIASSGSRDAGVFRSIVSGDGPVAVDSSESGGSSTGIWRNYYFAMNKSGDGSGHAITTNGELQAIGGTGYNELGLCIGTGTNTGSRNGTVHGLEYLIRDGTGAVQTTGTAQSGTSTTVQLASGAITSDDQYNDYAIYIDGGTGSGQWRMISDSVASTDTVTVDTAFSTTPDNTSTYQIIRALSTFLANVIARNAVYYGASDRKNSYSFYASAEGDYSSTAILKASVECPQAWNIGIDFEDITFDSGYALQMEENTRINWTDGANNSQLYVNASGNMVFAIAGSAITPASANTKTIGANGLRFNHGYFNDLTIGSQGYITYDVSTSGRARAGLVSGNDYEIEVSTDGSTWTNGLTVHNATNRVEVFGPFQMDVVTVANLPGSPVQGDFMMVSDANATTSHSVVAGSGSNILPVYYDGTNWRIV